MQATLVAMSWGVLTAAAPAPLRPDESSLRAADGEQMRIIVQEDAKAQQEFMHPNYMLNGPANAVKRKPELVAMLARGDIASDKFERKVEGVAITGDVGVVMGSEIVTPAPNRILDDCTPVKPCTVDTRTSSYGRADGGGFSRGRRA